MGLVTRFSPSHIAQFWRDWTAMLGYRSADQNGGYLQEPLSSAVMAGDQAERVLGVSWPSEVRSARYSTFATTSASGMVVWIS